MKVDFCLVVNFYGLRGNSSMGKLHGLGMLAVALGHRGVKGGLEAAAWRAVPPPARQTAGKLCSWYYELVASPRVTWSCSMGRKLFRMMQTRCACGW